MEAIQQTPTFLVRDLLTSIVTPADFDPSISIPIIEIPIILYLEVVSMVLITSSTIQVLVSAQVVEDSLVLVAGMIIAAADLVRLVAVEQVVSELLLIVVLVLRTAIG